MRGHDAPYVAQKGDLQIGGFGRRVAAYLVDGVLLAVSTSSLVALLGGSPSESGQPSAAEAIAFTAAPFVYFAIAEVATHGRTFGKWLLGLRVVDQAGRRPLGWRRSLLRNTVRPVSTLPFYLGCLWALRDPANRTWHDLTAKSLVVREPEGSALYRIAQGERGDLSVGTNTLLSGLLTMVVLPIWGVVEGSLTIVLGGLLCGGILSAVGYALVRAEEPPKPPPT